MSPTEGIDTDQLRLYSKYHIICRNEVSPTEGIDTLIPNFFFMITSISRNEVSPTEGIDTFNNSISILSPP